MLIPGIVACTLQIYYKVNSKEIDMKVRQDGYLVTEDVIIED